MKNRFCFPQADCEKNLEIAMPALNAAIKALDTLKQQDITIIKTMQNPPQGVKLVMEAICIMKVQPCPNWQLELQLRLLKYRKSLETPLAVVIAVAVVPIWIRPTLRNRKYLQINSIKSVSLFWVGSKILSIV